VRNVTPRPEKTTRAKGRTGSRRQSPRMGMLRVPARMRQEAKAVGQWALGRTAGRLVTQQSSGLLVIGADCYGMWQLWLGKNPLTEGKNPYATMHRGSLFITGSDSVPDGTSPPEYMSIYTRYSRAGVTRHTQGMSPVQRPSPTSKTGSLTFRPGLIFITDSRNVSQPAEGPAFATARFCSRRGRD